MPTPDDERFKQYLSEFKPVPARPLPIERRAPAIWRSWVFALPAVAALTVLVAAFFAVHLHRKPAGAAIVKSPANPTAIEQLANSQPLTLHRANDLLAQAPSFKAALDNVAFQRQRGDLPKGSKSALSTLGKEDIKL
ncbi:MAG TPA: hypothetical protein VG206_25210 [Terriglobia bacterium]|nr:hypothetical protein [Terriglobia bacterium]